ncbi:hypothetical protein [Sphingomonas sp. GC_Shp_2]|uniref:hypothetical protein n=1 Tax=Sphingomonas sp. GC_Shp_2 TaxID=2937384 RepID=UPI00226AD172|nr:hypothetical protein [Sphingomonas sp. GC_Shp_2]
MAVTIVAARAAIVIVLCAMFLILTGGNADDAGLRLAVCSEAECGRQQPFSIGATSFHMAGIIEAKSSSSDLPFTGGACNRVLPCRYARLGN